MASNYSSQNPQRTEGVIPVSALNHAVAQLLERNFPLTWVSGEISNFTRAASGHWYFTLKDSAAQVRAVMFRGRAQYANFMPREGDKVEVRALVSLYEPRGDFQINVEAIRRAGVGNLYEAFLQLKSKLADEGLFDPQRKKPIPTFVRRIGVITSPNAAALRDVLTALQRRAPHIEVIIYPCPVQGEGAAAKIAQMVALAEAEASCELLIVCRGGGSIEDLWAFNEEILARTIAHCSLPVISGVGHETDFTITDFVADLRAPTPTAAAEMAATPTAEWLATLYHWQQLMQRQIRRQADGQAQKLDWLSHRLQSPSAALQAKRQQIIHSAQSLRFAMTQTWRNSQSHFLQLQTKLEQKKPNTSELKAKLDQLSLQFRISQQLQLRQQKALLTSLQEKMEMLNPQRTLERGYVILQQADGKLVRSATQIKPGDVLKLRTASDASELQIAGINQQN
ncbi:exodeoxyribonuclease VII large subunit [Undibacterium flavidum]|uniref:Exodeoxyribonuclease 7 large subunit n=1 Tax=Undibacterium flavidum TaxID=2762297 RepID=A0ABR6YE04_9BURK|nr:exodeoxyribonuclease VII large subunit [Undibacterium flavidum]MBC3874753.1 exodeoxyribonuclease VII large subunit [Undibacterium flavidum]